MTATPTPLDAQSGATFSLPGFRTPAETFVAWLYGALVVSLVGFSSGGFLPTAWGSTAVVCFAAAAAAWLLREQVEITRVGAACLAALAAFCGWAALSAIWSSSVTSTLQDVQRDLAYLAIAAAGLALASRRTASALAGGVATGTAVISLYALATRLLPARFAEFSSAAYGYRLTLPVTYWNALGAVAALALLLCFAFATRAEGTAARVVAGAVTPALGTTVFFTFSRGAWGALALGFLVALALDRRRLHLILWTVALGPWTALAVLSADRRPGLTHIGATLAEAKAQGRDLGLIIAALAGAAATTTLGLAIAERHVAVAPPVRRALATFLVFAALGAGVLGWVEKGAPWLVAAHAWDRLNALPARSEPDLTTRLFQLSSSGRLQLWKGALNSFDAQPLLGNGAGTFWEVWPRYRKQPLATTQAHSIVFGTLAELGLPGIILLGAALLLPFAAAVRARARPLTAPLAGAYAAWLAHCATDWDWQLLSVGAAGLLVGISLLVQPGAVRVTAFQSAVLAAASGAVAALVFVGLLGDRALAAASRELRAGKPAAALSDFDRAASLQPWSSEADSGRAAVAVLNGDQVAAARYLRVALRKDRESWTLWRRLADVTTGREHGRAVAEAHRLNPYP